MPDYFETTHAGSFWRQRGDQPLLFRSRIRELRRRAGDQALLLDVGSGEGFFAARAAASGLRVFALDYLREGASRSGRLLPRRTVQGDGSRLPFHEDSFDVLTAWDVLEHLPSPETAVFEFRRVLRAGGWLYVSTPNPGALSVRCRGTGSSQYADRTHVNIRSRSAWMNVFQDAGLSVRAAGGDAWWDPPYFYRRLSVLFKALSQAMYIRVWWPIRTGENLIFVLQAEK